MFPKISMEVRTSPSDLKLRMARIEAKFNKKMKVAMQIAMKAIHKAVPAYPPKPPGSRYVRTGLLGWMLGKTMAGGILATPSVYNFKSKRHGEWEGHVGADKPWYVKRVAVQQEQPWKSYWWNEKDWRDLAEKDVQGVYLEAAEDMARFMAGRTEKIKGI